MALVSPLAKDVSGQIFGARGNDIQLYSQPRPIANLTREQGWTPSSIINEALKELEPKYFPVASNRQMGGPVPVQS